MGPDLNYIIHSRIVWNSFECKFFIIFSIEIPFDNSESLVYFHFYDFIIWSNPTERMPYSELIDEKNKRPNNE